MSNCANGSSPNLGQLTTPTRNLWPYGKLLDSYHLDLEGWYYRLQRYAINWLVHGSGVVCGLQVVVDAQGMVGVTPGFGFDLVGREIEVPQMSKSIDPRQPTDDCGIAQGSKIEGAGTVTLCLAYHECEAELIPLLVSECECEQRCAASTVCERYALIIRSGEPDTTAASCMLPGIFGADATPSSIHATLVDRISQACPPKPADTCIVLARITLPADGGPVTAADIDTTPRPLVVGNGLLLELLLCLAARVEACCNGKTTKTKALEKIAGDNQTGPANTELPAQPTVLVQEDAAPLAGEVVTFTVTGGGGTVSSGGPFADSAQVTTDSNGHAAITWKLGDSSDENMLRASIASGAPPVSFTATPTAKLAPPRVMLVWPPNKAKLGHEDAEANALLESWHKNGRRFEITFDRAMNSAQLAAPKTWLRIWRIRFDQKNQKALITPVELSFDANNPPTLPAAATMGPTATYRFEEKQAPSETIRYAIQIRAGGDGGDIESADPEPQLLDADFAGTNLPAHTGGLLKDLWNITTDKTTIGAFWNYLPGAAGTPPASGDGTAGGIYHGYFEVE
jgi:hypothetical protein